MTAASSTHRPAVVGTSHADILIENGLLPIIVPTDVHKELLASPGAVLKVDLANQTLHLPSGKAVQFPIDPFSKECLMEGVDELGYMLKQDGAIQAFEAKRVGSVNTLQ